MKQLSLAICLVMTLFGSGLIGQVQSLQVQVNSSTDDAEERGANAGSNPGLMDLSSTDLELVLDGNDGDQYVGIRFTGVTIPQGAVILNAYIQFTVDEDDDSTGTVIWRVEDVDNSSTFGASSFDISSRALMPDSVVWSNIPVWPNVGVAGPDQQTPDLSILVQSIVNRPAWQSGNALNFIAYGTGERVAESYDGSASSAPILVVEYIVPVVATFPVLTGNDDAEMDVANGAMDLGSSDLELTTDGSSLQLIAMRFDNVNIPSGSVIQDAYIQFTVDEVNTTGNVDVYISMEDADNSAPITNTAGELGNRNYLDSVIWNALPGWNAVGDAGSAQQTPNIAGLLQQIIDRGGWASGNAVMAAMIDPFVLSVPGYSGNAAKRVAQSYDRDPAAAAKLVVSYIPPAVYQVGTFPISAGGSWKYDDSGTPLDTANWTDVAYNDSSWAFGNAILGYGNGNEITTLDFGSDPGAKHPTYYLRNTFIVPDASVYDSLVFNLLRDDGAIVYVNGVEAFRSNMPGGTVDYNTLALAAVGGSNETTYFQTKTANLLQNGANVIAVELHQASAGSSDLSFDLEVGFELPPLSAASYPFPQGSDWHYLDDGSSLDAIAWKDTLFNDDNWEQGPGPLGYGDPMNTTISFGPDPNNKYITYYFRRDINIDLSAVGDSVLLGLRRDDGAVVYINGVEVVRDNMPAGTITSTTLAPSTVAGGNETTYFSFFLDKNVFRDGRNQIAVEVHNRDVFSSDLGFDLFIEDAPVANPPALGCEDGNDGHIACFTSIAPTSQTSNMLLPTSSHRFQMIFKQGDAYTIGGGTVPGNHDFTGFVGLNGSSEVGHLSVNHENTPGGVSMIDLHYVDSTLLWVIDTTRAVDFYNNDLVTTTRNCSGGITPWGTIITAEETSNSADVNADGYTDVGWLVEIDPITAKVKEYGNGIQEKLWAAGRVSHENAVVLNDSITLYTGEDGGSSAVFKFIADTPGDLSSGALYVLKLDSTLVGGEPTVSTGTWLSVPNTTQTERSTTRSLAIGLGATNFSGVEDIEVSPLDGKMYFTSKGLGRIFRFSDNGNTVSDFETFVGGTSYVLNTEQGVFIEPWGGGNDNLTFDDLGNLWVLQDGGNDYVWVVTPDHTQADPKVELFMSAPIGSEPTGLTFSPDYRFGFISIQHPSSANTPQQDATGNAVSFDASATIVFARDNYLGAQLPIAGFEADTQVVELGNTVTFTDTSLNFPTSRFWVFNGGVPAISTQKVQDVTFPGVGVFTVELYVSNAAGSDTAVYQQYIEVVSSVDVEDELAAMGLKLYPNPTQGEISLEMNLEGGEDIAVEIYDITGRKLAQLLNTTASAGASKWNFDLSQTGANQAALILSISVDGKQSRRLVQVTR